MERPLSAARKASVEERDPEEMACKVRQAIQRENDPVQSPELFSRNTVCLPHTLHFPLSTTYLKYFSLLLTIVFMVIQGTYTNTA